MKSNYLKKLHEIKLSVELMYLYHDQVKIEAIGLINELILTVEEDIYTSSVIEAINRIDWEKERKLMNELFNYIQQKNKVYGK